MPRNCCWFWNHPSWLSQLFMCIPAWEQWSVCARFGRCCPHIPKQGEKLSKNIFLPFFTQAPYYSGNEHITINNWVCMYSFIFCILPCSKKRFMFMLYFRTEHLTWCLEHSTQQMLKEWMFQQSNSKSLSQELYCKILRAQSNCLVYF